MCQASEEAEHEEMMKMLQDEAMKLADMNIVVSGMAGRFPKADNVNQFEEFLFDGVDMISDNDNSRYACGLWNLPARAGRLNDLTKFDQEFFHYTINQANQTDHQLRILYEVVYESILDSGVNPAELRGTKTGVFLGLYCCEFDSVQMYELEPKTQPEGYLAQHAVKIAQYFDFRGITATYDTACASGFVAMYAAVEALNEGLIEQAVVASVNIPINPVANVALIKLQMLSPTGYSRFMDSRADGYVKSEACAALFIQRKHVARRNYSSIMSILTNADGYKPEGITFPSIISQEILTRQAKQMAGISTNHVQYIEAHGTGTPAGDPQEAQSITNVYVCDFPSKDLKNMEQEKRKIGPLLIGSSKTNIGHTEGASGLCAMIKVALMLENEIIYKSLHFSQPNPAIKPLIEGKLKMVVDSTPLLSKVVPLSCYGFGGCDVHAIVRANEKPVISDREQFKNKQSIPRLVVMFGRTKSAINAFFDSLLNKQSRNTRNCLSDDFLALVDSLSAGKIDRLMRYRGFMIVDRGLSLDINRELELCELDQNIDVVEESNGRKHPQEVRERGCNLVLPGLGCEWYAMASGLTNYKPFWSTIERLRDHLEPYKVDLVALLTQQNDCSMLKQSLTNLFVSIVAYQIALINLIRDQLELYPIADIVGHSVGEVSCGYAAGLLDERTAIMTAYTLGKILDDNRNQVEGKMVALDCGEKIASQLIINYKTLRISCINGLESVTISGSIHEIDSFCHELGKQKLNLRIIPIESCSIAIHNEAIMTQEMKGKLTVALEKCFAEKHNNKLNPKLRWISSVASMSTYKNSVIQIDANYYAECMCSKVDFFSSVKKLEDKSIVLELAPCGTLESQVKYMTLSDEKTQKFHYVKLMNRHTNTGEQVLELLKGLGRLYLAGAVYKKLTQYHMTSEKEEEVEKQDLDLFPVRRQTPSLSSLIKWDHSETFFVPKHPNQFGKATTKTDTSIDIHQPQHKYISDHNIEGRVLFPATGYLLIVWRFFSFVNNKTRDTSVDRIEDFLCPVEFHSVRFIRPVVINQDQTTIELEFDESTGQFELSEGGSIVATGFARCPLENPTGLLYEEIRNNIKRENLNVEALNSTDIYTLFRVRGYDYGDSFRNIISASSNGKVSLIKYNGMFDAFLDCILQTTSLAVKKYITTEGALFLPTKIDYARFQPELILKKLKETDTQFSVNQDNKVEPEDNIEVEGEKKDVNNFDTENKETEQVTANDEEIEQLCLFETYHDAVCGIMITDGIEIRGFDLTIAPRRVDNNAVLYESYKYVRDIEDPIQDDQLTGLEQDTRIYSKICDSMTTKLLELLFGKSTRLFDNIERLNEQSHEMYLNKFLTSIYNLDNKDDKWDTAKNKPYILMSVLDQLLKQTDQRMMCKILANNQLYLAQDVIKNGFFRERLARSVLEMIVENVCLYNMNLRILEINTGDGLLYRQLTRMLHNIDASLSINYTLAHENIDRVLPSDSVDDDDLDRPKALELTELEDLFANKDVNNLNFIVYKDLSCYNIVELDRFSTQVKRTIDILSEATLPGGFIMIAAREEMTFAERITILLTKCDDELNEKQTTIANDHRLSEFVESANYANVRLKYRIQLFIDEAKNANLLFVCKKKDENGCTLLLFRKKIESSIEQDETERKLSNDERLILRVKHGSKESISEWFEVLRDNFKSDDVSRENDEEYDDLKEKQERECSIISNRQKRVVWLCAVETRQQRASGIVGMMQSLRKELGSQHLRCFYDCHTFKQCDEPIDVAQIEQSANFRRAVERDLIWNCIDSQGNFGSFRHFNINNYFNHDDCLCSNNPVDEQNGEEISLSPGQELKLNEYAYVNYSTRGDLSSFTWYELPSKYLSDEEKKKMVKVAYSALNFKDVMLSTGQLPLDAIPFSVAKRDCSIGFEFSGINLSSNERIMGLCLDGIATHIYCAEHTSFTVKVPDWLSLEEAATIPAVYTTAVMALIQRGKMQPGESVLIHAGSGGVGQAAIRLAAHYGLTIYTTVGSEEKKRFLLEEFAYCLEESRIFSSRDCMFEKCILEATQGKGVDMVLNSLTGDKFFSSVRCLATGGRFLEIGKYEQSINTRLELLNLDINKTIHGYCLDMYFDPDTTNLEQFKVIQSAFKIIVDGIEKGFVKPIKYTTFKRHQIEDAFRYMATGKHIGKILVEMDSTVDTSARSLEFKQRPPRSVPKFQPSGKKSYIVTGGLGGFGMELTKWLVGRGARYILLTSRSGVRTGYQKLTLERLQSNSGAKILVFDSGSLDTTSISGVRKLCDVALKHSPVGELGGVFHLAMVYKDLLIENMSSDDFEYVCRPKINTFVYLDQVTRELNLQVDYFVAFSSCSSGKGNIGQANYSYANSCIERICEQRRSFGCHSLAIQWGLIGDVGVIYETLGGNEAFIGGLVPQRMHSCLNSLSSMLSSPFTICSSCVTADITNEASGQENLLVSILKVLGIKDHSKLREEATLGELGLDSLMAVEIRQAIQRDHDITLNFQQIRSLTVEKIKELNSQKKSCMIETKQNVLKAEQQTETKKSEKLDKSNKITQKSQLDKIFRSFITENLVVEKPLLNLPEKEFCFLNEYDFTLERKKNQGTLNSLNPIFFIPPYQGDFKRLNKVCSNIKRPCIGINWTRKFGQAKTVKEVVDLYLDLLTRTDWQRELNYDSEFASKPLVVDLVGYSFGATMAFELMVELHNINANITVTPSMVIRLLPGRLFLLDSSPKLMELGSSFLKEMTKDLTVGEQVDNLIMIFIVSNVTASNDDFNQLQKTMSPLEIEEKYQFASERLLAMLKLNGEAKREKFNVFTKPKKDSTTYSDRFASENSYTLNKHNLDVIDEDEDMKTNIAHSMKAFCSRYFMMRSYKNVTLLPSSCTLMRTRQGNNVYSELSESLGLDSIVKGKVELFVMNGKHATFLDENYVEISDIIS